MGKRLVIAGSQHQWMVYNGQSVYQWMITSGNSISENDTNVVFKTSLFMKQT
jgi:hypothetical protein